MSNNKQNRKPEKKVVKTYSTKKDKKETKPVKSRSKAGTIARGIGKGIAVFILVLIISCCIMGTVFTIYVMDYVKSNDGIDLDNVSIGYTTTVYGVDSEGEYTEIQKIASNGKREWVDIENIPKMVQEAFVYAEDQEFYKHNGVDWTRTFGAFIQMVIDRFTGQEGNSFGGSTITQQLIKNVNGDFYNRDMTVKIKEILGSISVEQNNSKDRILECYLNYIDFGNNIYGISAAAEEYFGKEVSNLSIVEAASLACIAKAPQNYNPLDNPENNAERRKVPLKKMLEFGTITQAEYDEALGATLYVIGADTGEEDSEEDSADDKNITNGVYSWYVDAALYSVAEDLAEITGKTYSESLADIRSGGYQIYTPVDLEIQSKVEEMFLDDSVFYNKKLEEDPEGAMVIMDYTGNVVALVGGRDEKTSSLVFNRAVSDARSIGSCMKPITTYALALQTDLITYSTAFMDEPKRSKNGGTGATPDWPKNYNNVWTRGLIPSVDALKQSKNTIPVELMQLLGIENCFNFLVDELGISTLNPDSQDMSENLTLGMTSKGVYLDEITAAYLMFGNGGLYYTPKLYTQVYDVNGKLVLDNTTDTGSRVLEEDTAYIMSKMLEQVVTSGTGTTARLPGYQVLGKTGTSDDTKERTFVGMTPYYTASVRVGYDQTEEYADYNIKNSSYSPAIIWKTIMSEVLEDYEPTRFDLNSDGVVTRRYCTETGLLASDSCTSTAVGYYKRGVYPGTCAKDHGAVVTPDEDKLPNQATVLN